MSTILRMLVVCLVAGLCWVGLAHGQYMYLDANGDGLNTTDDRLLPNGTPTIVDVYLQTDHNKDGSVAVCDSHDGPLDINSYVVSLLAVGGTVTYSGYINRQPTMFVQFGEVNGGNSYKTGRGQQGTLVAGRYRLFTITITAETGSPQIWIVDRVAGTADITGFGSHCSGFDFDNTYKLAGPAGGNDWHDWDGLGIGSTVLPRINVEQYVAAAEGHSVKVNAVAFTSEGAGPAILAQTGAPPFLTFSSSSAGISPTASLTGVPGFSDAGDYAIHWTLSDGSQTLAVADTYLHVDQTDRPPRVSPISDVFVSEGTSATIPVSATDPDGGGIALYAALPPFSTMRPPTALSGSVSSIVDVMPDFDSAGDYSIYLIATSGCVSDATLFHIHVANVDRPPGIEQIEDISLPADSTLAIPVNAVDGDGDNVTVSGSIPTFGTLQTPTTGVGSVHTYLSVQPHDEDAGTHLVSLTAQAGALSATETFTVTVTTPNRGPQINAPSSISLNEGQPLDLHLAATDPDGDTGASLTASPLPLGAEFVQEAPDVGRFRWTPDFGQSGTYTVAFRGIDIHSTRDSAMTQIIVSNVNRPPTVVAGGPYHGITGAEVTFDGSASSDPDGDPVTALWSFGDGTTAVGMSASHIYQSSASYTVMLEVGDGTVTATASSLVDVQATLPALAAMAAGNSVIHLGSAQAKVCASVEPSGGGFMATDIDPASVALWSPGTGSVDHVVPIRGKLAVVSDQNGDGTDDVTVCFDMDEVRALFDGLSPGVRSIPATVQGTVLQRGSFLAPITLVVDAGDPSGSPLLAPNPMNPQGMLSFTVTRAGSVRVQIFDARGRLVRTVADRSQCPAGRQYLRVDGLDDHGRRLGSGVYLYRISTPGEASTGRFTIMK